MLNKKQKLELNWIGKEELLNLEPRILIEDQAKSYGDPNSENMLIQGDNLLALKALEQDFAEKIKCIYIDPPYNTGSAFEHYDDNLEHSIWLSLMHPRISLLKNLLSDDGSIWINLDDTEVYYFKVLCDEIFGRKNFIGSIIWEKSDSPRMDAQFFSVRHDFILVYAKKSESLIFNRLKTDEVPEHYNKVDEKGKRYYLKPLRVMGGNISESLFFPMIAPDGTKILPYESDGTKSCWRWSQNKINNEKNRIEWVNGRNGWNPYFRIYADSRQGMPTETIWKHQEVGSNRTSKNEIRQLFKTDLFDTPKPEKLISKILDIATNENDWILDSFLGSGTTSAVAHKKRRNWIGVEIGDHATSHCLPRLKKVVDGNDGLLLSETLNWKGGGGFKFYNLAPSLLRKDNFDNFVIDEKYNPNMLAAAMCKHEGFKYAPDESTYWKQGKSTESDYIFVTTGFITLEQLDSIHAQMTENESLLICAKTFSPECEHHFSNITVKKIPQMILGKCEFGKDNYDLNIIKETETEAEESNEAEDE